ncbi:MAG: type II secretion system protein [Dehalococcoidia bacterium]|jgi:type II secretory pathway pseudopilin PulG
MSKRGTTLIESVISIFIISVVLLMFLEGLNVGMTGTLELNRKTSALNLAKSQMDAVKAYPTYNVSTGNLSDIYGPLITAGGNISDIVNYNISGQVSNVSTYQGLQEITINVSYFTGKEVLLTGYKSSDGSLVELRTTGMRVTDNIPNVPTLPQGYGGLCLGSFRGYYHVFTTGTAGPVSMNWKFDWTSIASAFIDIGCPIIAVYNGTPDWTITDYQGEVRENGIIVRQQNGLWLFDVAGIGDLPGPGGGESMCKPCDDDYYDPDEENPLYYMPHHHSSFGIWLLCLFYSGSYPCCGYSLDGTPAEVFWSYDNSGSSGTAEDTLVTTGNLSVGTYTVLFFNAENVKNLNTVSASVSYLR